MFIFSRYYLFLSLWEFQTHFFLKFYQIYIINFLKLIYVLIAYFVGYFSYYQISSSILEFWLARIIMYSISFVLYFSSLLPCLVISGFFYLILWGSSYNGIASSIVLSRLLQIQTWSHGWIDTVPAHKAMSIFFQLPESTASY